MFNLILVELRQRWTTLLWWGIGIGAYLALILSMAPELAAQFSTLNLEDMAIYQAFGVTDAISSTAALIAIYVTFIGITIGVYAIIAGTGTLAGEEDAGTLEVMLTLPLPRWQLVLAKAIVLALSIAAILLVSYVGYLLAYPSVAAEVDFTRGELLVSTLESWPLAFVFAMFGMLMGALLPRRGHALGLSLLALLGSYLFNNLADAAEPLRPLRPYQPFYYNQGGAVLTDGLDWSNVVVLTVVGLVFLLLALVTFARRNVTVHAWPWTQALARR